MRLFSRSLRLRRRTDEDDFRDVPSSRSDELTDSRAEPLPDPVPCRVTRDKRKSVRGAR